MLNKMTKFTFLIFVCVLLFACASKDNNGENPAIAHIKKAISFEDKDNYDKAIEYAEKALKLIKEKDTEKEILGGCYNLLGRVYQKKTEYNKAIEYYNMALKVLLECWEDLHIKTKKAVSQIYYELGVINDQKNELDQAIKYFQKALQTDLELEKSDYRSDISMYSYDYIISSSYSRLGLVYQKQGNYEKAIENLNKALERSLSRFSNEKKFEEICRAIGLSNGGYKVDKELIQFVVDDEEPVDCLNIVIADNINLGTTYKSMYEKYKKNKFFDDSLRYYQNALRASLSLFGSNNNLTKEIKNSLSLLKKISP